MKTSIRTHEERVTLVTDAGQGIGQAIAVALAERGARVIATDLKPPQETAKKIGLTATALQLDVTQEEDWRSASVKSRDAAHWEPPALGFLRLSGMVAVTTEVGPLLYLAGGLVNPRASNQ